MLYETLKEPMKLKIPRNTLKIIQEWKLGHAVSLQLKNSVYDLINVKLLFYFFKEYKNVLLLFL